MANNVSSDPLRLRLSAGDTSFPLLSHPAAGRFEWEQLGTIRSAKSQAEENERIAAQFPEAVVTIGDIDIIDEFCAEDIVDRSPFGDVWRPETLMEQLNQMRAVASDFTVTDVDVVAEGDTVAMRVTLRATEEGDLLGIPATAQSFEVANMVFTRVEDGKIAERWVFPDLLGLMQQLGIVARLGRNGLTPKYDVQEMDQSNSLPQ